jgi:hypothetical protein
MCPLTMDQVLYFFLPSFFYVRTVTSSIPFISHRLSLNLSASVVNVVILACSFMIESATSSSPSIGHVHQSNHRQLSTIQHQRMECLSSLSYLNDWPTDIIRIVTDYMSIQLWLAFEEPSYITSSLIMVLNLTSLRTEMKNNTLVKVNPKIPEHRSSRPVIHECKGVLEATHEWSSWGPSLTLQHATYAVIDNILVSISISSIQ